MWSIYFKEVGSFLNSLIAYLVMSVFLITTGLLVWVFPETNIFDYGYADLGIFFNMVPFVFMFLIPAVTMRLIAEESKSGMLQLLLTKPVSEFKLVTAKFLAGLSLVVVTLIPTIVYYFSLSYISNPEGNVDTAGIMGAYLGLIFLAGAYTAIGLFASSLSENQIVAFIIALFFSFFLFMGFGAIANIPAVSNFSQLIAQIGMQYHYESLGKGLIDLRDVVYFISLTFVFIYATFWMLKLKKWNS